MVQQLVPIKNQFLPFPILVALSTFLVLRYKTCCGLLILGSRSSSPAPASTGQGRMPIDPGHNYKHNKTSLVFSVANKEEAGSIYSGLPPIALFTGLFGRDRCAAISSFSPRPIERHLPSQLSARHRAKVDRMTTTNFVVQHPRHRPEVALAASHRGSAFKASASMDVRHRLIDHVVMVFSHY